MASIGSHVYSPVQKQLSTVYGNSKCFDKSCYAPRFSTESIVSCDCYGSHVVAVSVRFNVANVLGPLA